MADKKSLRSYCWSYGESQGWFDAADILLPHQPQSYFLLSIALSLRFLRPRAKAALSSRSRCSHSRSSTRLGEMRMDNNLTCSYPLPLERERTLAHISIYDIRCVT